MMEIRIRRPMWIGITAVILSVLVLCGMQRRVCAAPAPNAAQVRSLADKIIKQQTKKTSKKDKAARLEKVFRYADKKFAFRPVADKAFIEASLHKQMSRKNILLAAGTMLKKKRGTCFHEAAGLAYLIRRSTGWPTRIVIGKTDAFSGEWQLHAWVETCVNGAWQVFDSNLDRSKGSALTWYGIPADGSDERFKHYQGEWNRNV